jgi:hypothetical protein
MKDIIITTDIQIISGDLMVEISDIQHVEHILKANLGQFYQYPDIGYGINKKLNGTFNPQSETANIKKALDNDSIQADQININASGDNFQVDVKFKRK